MLYMCYIYIYIYIYVLCYKYVYVIRHTCVYIHISCRPAWEVAARGLRGGKESNTNNNNNNNNNNNKYIHICI